MKDLEEAEAWIAGAEFLLSRESSEADYTVVVAMCVHAIIKANDALTNRYLFRTAMKHEEAPELFLKLIEQGKIDKKYDPIRKEILIPAIRIKSMVDYRGTTITQPTAQSWIENAKTFVTVAKDCLKSSDP